MRRLSCSRGNDGCAEDVGTSGKTCCRVDDVGVAMSGGICFEISVISGSGNAAIGCSEYFGRIVDDGIGTGNWLVDGYAPFPTFGIAAACCYFSAYFYHVVCHAVPFKHPANFVTSESFGDGAEIEGCARIGFDNSAAINPCLSNSRKFEQGIDGSRVGELRFVFISESPSVDQRRDSRVERSGCFFGYFFEAA